LVTALFCDLVGFTPLSERLDVEDVRGVQVEYFTAVRREIEQFGGTVEKYAGDAVLALFGAPMAHQDDAERAVLCAIAVVSAVEPVIRRVQYRWQTVTGVRIGVNTGEVVSGTWAVGGHQDAAVTGDAVNTAARLQAAARPGQVLVGEETMRLSRRRIEYGPPIDLSLKGKSRDVRAYSALGVRVAPVERWEVDQAAPLVGREREMASLTAAWTRACSGEGGLVSLVGEPGVGKSRLVAEFVEGVAGEHARVFRGRCVSYGREVTLWLISDLLRATVFSIHPEVSISAREQLARVIGSEMAACDEETRVEAIEVFGELLGLTEAHAGSTSAAEQRRVALARSIRLLMSSLVQSGPVLVVLEDMHWIDTASSEILGEVLRDLPGLRALVLATHRSGWSPPWADWGWTDRLTVRPLDSRSTSRMAHALLGSDLSPELRALLLEKAEGNPFFVEELLRSLRDNEALVRDGGSVRLAPGAVARLPATLSGILLERLDRLEAESKRAAQIASVIGRAFSIRLLAEVAGTTISALDRPLDTLQRAEIAFPRHGPEREYAFKHVSMRDAAYGMLVHGRRRELHLRTARAMASLYPHDEQVDIIAYHYRQAEAPEAALWLERAGDRAARMFANDLAASHYREALDVLDLTGAQPADIARLNEKIALPLLLSVHLAGRGGQEGLAAIETAETLYAQLGDVEGAGRAAALLQWAPLTQEQRLQRYLEALERLAGQNASLAAAALNMAAVPTYFYMGRYREMLAAADTGRVLAERLGDKGLVGRAWIERGLALATTGSGRAAREAYERGLPLLEEAGQWRDLARALILVGEICKNLGDLEAGQQYDHRGLAAAERTGTQPQIQFLHSNLAEKLLVLGRWSEAQQHADLGTGMAGALVRATIRVRMGALGEARSEAERVLDAEQGSGNRYHQFMARTLLAEVALASGDPDAALRHLEAVKDQEGVERIVLLTLLASAYLHAGKDTAGAEAMVREAVEIARTHENVLYLVDALLVYGRALRVTGRSNEAEVALAEALMLARSMPYPYAEAQVLEARGETGEALVIYRRLGAVLDAERLEAGAISAY
jgi:class 3 adenylate cyclase/tetratricopeptide (TPR) repeat protein/ABC-type cobalamin transport system ATPase subunit